MTGVYWLCQIKHIFHSEEESEEDVAPLINTNDYQVDFISKIGIWSIVPLFLVLICIIGVLLGSLCYYRVLICKPHHHPLYNSKYLVSM